ncbi:MAG: outer membrane beta-barrel protein [Thermoguttaceae bacterium]|nr:outer membrane beta-barrel protein [Thermoguttaceae bacterium]MDO4857069.1 outer membrane beta-barrel protein [Thermoguttaceae bacterium]
MNIINTNFKWKTVLKGFASLLVLVPLVQAENLDAPGSFDHDSYWASLDASTSGPYGQQASKASSEQTQAPAAIPASDLPCQEETIYGYMESPEPEGLFLYRFNQSEAARVGSRFLGPGNFFINGYVDQGIRWGNAQDFQPMGMNDHDGYQMNQAYLSFGRKVERADQFSIGYQMDVMYGSDYYYMSSVGLETRDDNQAHWNGMKNDPLYRAGRSEYGIALPQAFVEVYMPFVNGLDLKVGHFDSIMGYESLQANKNFFYSQTYSKIYAMPTSMTGAIGTFGLINGWNFILGGVTEWNTFDSINDNFSGVIGFTKESADQFFTFASTFMIGKQTSPCYQMQTTSDQQEMCYVFNTYGKFRLAKRLNYVIEFTAGYDDREYQVLDWASMPRHRGRAWFGLTNYLLFQVTDSFSLGARFEWFNDADSTVIDGGYDFAWQDKASNYYALTIGANWTPLSWLTIRPEVRYDFSDFDVDGMQTYDGFTKKDMITFGADAIIRF